MRKRKKRGIAFGWEAASAITILLLLLIIAIQSIKIGRLNGQVEALSLELDQIKGRVEEPGGQAPDQEKGDRLSTTAVRTSPAPEPDETQPEAPVSETTMAPSAEAEPAKLKTLDGIRAGTVVTEDELDKGHMEQYFQAFEIKTTGNAYSRINGKSYRENQDVALMDLRYLKVLHYNFNHEKQVGELIVNVRLADEFLEIFRELYDAEYEIKSMRLVDDYWVGNATDSDTESIDHNNTSAFNYRPATGGGKLSKHAYGYAIDINPQQNPYVSYSSGKPNWSHSNANDYIARDTGLPHVITHEDTAYKIFTAHGFTWGGDWNNPKDYQHFEKRE